MKPWRRECEWAFSLIEVVIAIGIFAVAIVGILSLMSNALKVARLSASDTVLAMLTQELSAELKAKPFADLLAQFVSGTSVMLLFREDGSPTTNSLEAIYACRIAGSFAPTNGGYSNATLFTGAIQFAWPVAAPAAARDKLVVPITVAAYER